MGVPTSGQVWDKCPTHLPHTDSKQIIGILDFNMEILGRFSQNRNIIEVVQIVEVNEKLQ